jgi:hypothetical protein
LLRLHSPPTIVKIADKCLEAGSAAGYDLRRRPLFEAEFRNMATIPIRTARIRKAA